MDYIRRDIEKTIIEASESYSALIVTGPRQVGKTTTLRRLAESNRAYVTLDDIEARRMAKDDPELFLSVHRAPLLIDEVQYAPELFSRIKIEIDRGAPPGSYWMTGSQAFRLMQLAGESLAGRVAILRMSPLSQHEIFGSGSHEPFELGLAKLAERTERPQTQPVSTSAFGGDRCPPTLAANTLIVSCFIVATCRRTSSAI